MKDFRTLVVSADHAQSTLAAVLRSALPELSWSRIKALVSSRKVKIQGELCLDPARRLKEGDQVEILPKAEKPPTSPDQIVIRHVDEHLVVVEKPAGICTVRHPLERDWSDRRRALSPTLDDLVALQLGGKSEARGRSPRGRLRIVHRLDKETSGLLVYARTVAAERGLGRQFHDHQVHRRYMALVSGRVSARRIHSFLVRDRGDGRRGSTTVPGLGKEAITHVEPQELLPHHTLLLCRLETGRTHQIRIHLAEAGHPVCGDPVYGPRPGEEKPAKSAVVPRLALHAAELGFCHPITGENLLWKMPLPQDLQGALDRLQAGGAKHGDRG